MFNFFVHFVNSILSIDSPMGKKKRGSSSLLEQDSVSCTMQAQCLRYPSPRTGVWCCVLGIPVELAVLGSGAVTDRAPDKHISFQSLVTIEGTTSTNCSVSLQCVSGCRDLCDFQRGVFYMAHTRYETGGLSLSWLFCFVAVIPTSMLTILESQEARLWCIRQTISGV